MFAAEDGRPADAAALANRLPAASRTADVRALLAQADAAERHPSAVEPGRGQSGGGAEKLLTLAAQPDPDGTNGVAVARAFLQMGNPAAARRGAGHSPGSNPKADASATYRLCRVAAAGRRQRGANILIQAVDRNDSDLTPEQTDALNRLRAGNRNSSKPIRSMTSTGRRPPTMFLPPAWRVEPDIQAEPGGGARCMPPRMRRARRWRSTRRCWNAIQAISTRAKRHGRGDPGP